MLGEDAVTVGRIRELLSSQGKPWDKALVGQDRQSLQVVIWLRGTEKEVQ